MKSPKSSLHEQPVTVLGENIRKQKVIKPTGTDQGTHDYEPSYKNSERDRDEHTADENKV